jgi:hypothetical protein
VRQLEVRGRGCGTRAESQSPGGGGTKWHDWGCVAAGGVRGRRRVVAAAGNDQNWRSLRGGKMEREM